MNPSDERTLLTTTEFTDRVMTAISLAPMPTPTRTFVTAIRARALRDAVAALWVAWHLGTVRTWDVAPRVRARSFALVLAATSVLATGGLAAGAAVHSIVPQRPSVTAPSGSGDELGPATNGQTVTRGPDNTDDAGQSPTTSDEPDATDDGYDVSKGNQRDEADDYDGDHDLVDGDDPDDDGEPEETNEHDGSDDDGPAAADDHGDADDPDESNEPDETNDPDGVVEPDGIDDGDDGSSGGDDAPDGDGEIESDVDGSG